MTDPDPYAKCEHGIPRKFCTGYHKSPDVDEREEESKDDPIPGVKCEDCE